MRILCESCQSQYHIDDSFMSERGIRAQCPKCSHITVIQKTTKAIREDQRSRLPATEYCVNCGAPLAETTNDPIPLCSNCALDAQTADSQEKTDLDALEQPAFSHSPEESSLSSNTFTRAQLDDPASFRESERWRIKKAPDGRIYGPFDRQTIQGWIDSGKVTADDQISTVGGAWEPVARHSEFQGVPRMDRPPVTPSRPRRAPSGGRKLPVKWIVAGVVVLILGGAGVAGWRLGWIAALSNLVDDNTDTGPSPAELRVQALRTLYPNVQGDPAELREEGALQLGRDTIAAYEHARYALERAVVLEPANADGLALLGETYAVLAWYDGQDELLSDALVFALRARELDPTSIPAMRAHATVLLAKRENAQNRADATKILDAALPLAKDDAILIMLKGVAIGKRDTDEANKFLGRAISTQPKLARPRLELAALAIELHDYQRAITTLRPLSQRSIIAAYRLGDLYEQLGRYTEAMTYFARAASASRSIDQTSPHWRVRTSVRWARLRYQAQGATGDALQKLTSVSGKEITSTSNQELRSRLQVHLATLYRLRGRTAEAQAAAQVAIDDNSPLAPAARLQSALAAKRKGAFDDALKALEGAAVPSVSKHNQSVLHMAGGMIRADAGNVDEARAEFDKALRTDPYNHIALFADVALLIRNERDDEAIARVLELARRDPTYRLSTQRITDYYVGVESQIMDDAVRLVTEAKDRKSYEASSWTALGITKYYAGDRKGAVAAFQRALAEDNNFDPIAHLFLGLELTEQGKCAQALKEYESASEPALQNAHLFTSMGRCQWRMGQAQAAQENFTRAMNDDPGYAPAYYWAGELALKRNNREKAREQWQEAVRRDPAYLKAYEALFRVGG